MKFFRILCKYIFLYFFIPLLILVGIEGFLRYEGWGENRHPWRERVVENKKIYTKNMAFYQQFFEHPIHPGEFEPFITMIQIPKPENTIRIFVFGESAALGWPDSRYSMGNFLLAMLNMLYPEYNWEVFNVCFAGINSHIIRYLVENSLFLQPDLVIFYMGNNESHGTFGLLHSFRNSIPLSPWIVQTHIRLQHLYLVQQLRKFSLMVKQVLPKRRMRIVRWDDRRVNIVAKNFEDNLRSIIEILDREHIPVFVSTMGANLRDWLPIESWFRENISKEEVEEWKKYFGEGLNLISSGNIRQAKEALIKALKIDPTPAILNYFFAWTLLVEGDELQAKKYFLEACDKDGIGFVRSKSFINEIIQGVSKSFSDNQNIRLIPIAEELSTHAQNHIPGTDLFVDSCHLNFYGTYIIARAYLREIIKKFSLPSRDIPSCEDTKFRLGITRNKEKQLGIFIQVNKPLNSIYFPDGFKSFNYEEITNQLQHYIVNSTFQQTSSNAQFNSEDIEKPFYLLGIYPKNKNLLLSCLDVLNNLGAFRQGLTIAKKICDEYPATVNDYFILFDFACNVNDRENAELALRKIGELFDFLGEIYTYHALRWAIKQEQKEKAVEISHKLVSFSLALPLYKALAHCVLINEEKNLSFSEKLAKWKEVLQKNSWSFDSFRYVSKQIQTEQEKEMFKGILSEMIQNNVKSALPFIFMAHIYEDEKNIPLSIKMFQKSISVSPDNLFSYYELTRLLTKKAEELLLAGNIEEATATLEQAVQIFPYYAPAWLNLMDTCLLLGDEPGYWEKLTEWQEIQNKDIMRYLWEIAY